MDDYCFVCNQSLDGSLKTDLSMMTSYSEKPIYEIIQAFTETLIEPEQIPELGICQECVLKFNEYDELISRAEAIQVNLTQLLLHPKSPAYEIYEEAPEVEEIRIKDEVPDDDIAFEPIDCYFESLEGAEEIDPSLLTDDYQMEVVVEDDTKENFIGEPSRKGVKGIVVSQLRSIKKEDDVRVVHLDNNQRAFECDVCQKCFKDRSKLKSHREIHTTERNVICNECGKNFKTQNCLRNHKRMHMAVRTYYGCDQCEKKYTQKVQLKKHIEVVHMNRRDFACPTCGASFGTKSVLKMHMLSHSEFRPEECSVCGFRVHTKAKLRRHMKSHTGERDYECGICGKKFLYSYNVIAHVRNVHEKEKIKEYPELQQVIETSETIEDDTAIEYCYEEV